MKNSVLFTVFTVVTIAQFASCTDSYTAKYDNLDVDGILSNDRLYKKYFNCLIGAGKCTPDGRELKENLPEALATGCAKCTPKQKRGSEKVVRYLIEKRPDDWQTLEKIFDPMGEYRRRYKEAVLKRGIKLEVVTEPDNTSAGGEAVEGGAGNGTDSATEFEELKSDGRPSH